MIGVAASGAVGPARRSVARQVSAADRLPPCRIRDFEAVRRTRDFEGVYAVDEVVWRERIRPRAGAPV